MIFKIFSGSAYDSVFMGETQDGKSLRSNVVIFLPCTHVAVYQYLCPSCLSPDHPNLDVFVSSSCQLLGYLVTLLGRRLRKYDVEVTYVVAVQLNQRPVLTKKKKDETYREPDEIVPHW